MIMMPITRPAESMLKPGRPGISFCRKGVTIISAK
jgi:hypothetical protein